MNRYKFSFINFILQQSHKFPSNLVRITQGILSFAWEPSIGWPLAGN